MQVQSNRCQRASQERGSKRPASLVQYRYPVALSQIVRQSLVKKLLTGLDQLVNNPVSASISQELSPASTESNR